MSDSVQMARTVFGTYLNGHSIQIKKKKSPMLTCLKGHSIQIKSNHRSKHASRVTTYRLKVLTDINMPQGSQHTD